MALRVGRDYLKQSKMLARCHPPTETIEEIGDTIQLLVSKAFPGAGMDNTNQLAACTFLASLLLDLRHWVGDFEPTIPSDAIRKTAALELADMGRENDLQQDTCAAAVAFGR